MKIIIKSIKVFIHLLLIGLLSIGVLGIYASFIERNLLVSKDYHIEINKECNEEITVVQFSDTQLGEYYTMEQLKKAVKTINKANADIVVFTGDLIDNASKYEDIDKISNVLADINCTIGKYAIYGNHDYGGGAVRYYEDIMDKAGFTVLKNESTMVEVNKKNIRICGGDDALMGNFDAIETMEGIRESDMNLLLIHEPDLVEHFEGYPMDLVLSGHSHGGQVYIPFYGPIKKNILSEKYNRGIYNLSNDYDTQLYVNTGLGNTKVPYRFLTIPEIAVFHLKI